MTADLLPTGQLRAAATGGPLAGCPGLVIRGGDVSRMPVMCVTAILVGSTQRLIQFAYAARVDDDSWKDPRVREAEEALAVAVRTADEIIADVERAVTASLPPAPPEPPEPPDDEQPPILRDAW